MRARAVPDVRYGTSASGLLAYLIIHYTEHGYKVGAGPAPSFLLRSGCRLAVGTQHTAVEGPRPVHLNGGIPTRSFQAFHPLREAIVDGSLAAVRCLTHGPRTSSTYELGYLVMGEVSM